MNIDKDIEIVKEIVIKSRDLREEEFYKLIGIKQIQAISNVLADRETWKKIAEKLAEEFEKCTTENKEWYLDWAKSEVENETNKARFKNT